MAKLKITFESLDKLQPVKPMKITPWLTGLLVSLLSLPVAAHPGIHEQLRQLNQLIARHPNDQSLLIQRASAYSNDGHFDEALIDLLHAESLGQPIAAAYELGVLFYRKGELGTARAYFDTYLQHYPNHSHALEYRARVARDSNDFSSAIEDLRRLTQLKGRLNPGLYLAAARMLAMHDSEPLENEKSNNKGISPALVFLDEGMQQVGIIPQLQRKAILYELQLGNTEQALKRMQSLQSVLGDSPGWKIEMAELLLNNGRRLSAQQLLKQADFQLKKLKVTPARQQLSVRVLSLQATASQAN